MTLISKNNNGETDKKVESLVDFVRQYQGQDDGWCVITQRDVPKIANCSTFASRKLLEILKQHPNIVFEIDESRSSRRKPFRFRYVSEEEKKRIGIPDEGFYYLSVDEVRWVKSALSNESYSDIQSALSFINFMALSGAKKAFAAVTIKELTRFCRGGEKGARQILAKLIDHRLVLADPNAKDTYFLQLNEEAILKGSQLLDQSIKRMKLLGLSNSKIEGLEEAGMSIPEADIALKQEFKYFIETFKRFAERLDTVNENVQGRLDNALTRYNWLNAKEEELEKSYKITTALMEENATLKDELARQKHMISLLTNSLDKNNAWLNEVALKVGQCIDSLQAELLAEVEDFMHTPTITLETCNLFRKHVIETTVNAAHDIGLIMIKKE